MRTCLLVLSLVLSGCFYDSAGPFVKSVRPLPDGRLRVHLCHLEVRWNPFTGISTDEHDCVKAVLSPDGPTSEPK